MMKAPKTLQAVFKRMVAISIICVIVLTTAAGLTAYLIASKQDKNDSDFAGAVASAPLYHASALILVQSGSLDSSDSGSPLDDNKVKTNDITDSVLLANTCATLFTSDPDMKSILSGSGASVTITPVEDSYFLRITAESSNPRTAANTANLIANTAPSVFRKYYDEGMVAIVEEAAVPSKPYKEEYEQTTVKDEKPDTLHIVLIASLAALSGSMIVMILLNAVVYAKQKNKYETYRGYAEVSFGQKV